MKRFLGFSADTPKKIMTDVGALFENYDFEKSYQDNVTAGRRLGATQGGTTFAANPQGRYIKVDGMPENTKGMYVIDEWKPTMAPKLLEQDAKNVKRALGAAKQEPTTIDSHKYNKLTPKDSFDDDDYINNITLATKIKGSDFPVLIVLFNTISFGGLSWSFSDKSELTSDVTFNGHYTVGELGELSEPPFAIYVPEEIDEATVVAAMVAAEVADAET